MTFIETSRFLALRYSRSFLVAVIVIYVSWAAPAEVEAQASLPKVVAGTIERLDSFPSIYVTPRNVDVWLPPGYSDQKRYAALYMHDGQMLYDAESSWNKQAWDVDDVAAMWLADEKWIDFIVVGIWNGGPSRHEDYFPQTPFEQLSSVERDTVNAQLKRTGRSQDSFAPQSDNYLKFIVEELKPYIDRTYAVREDKDHTFIAGSSMGGLISMYAICEYPSIFGGAACLSTHWPGTFQLESNPVPEAFVSYLQTHLPDPKDHKIYFDCGDQTLDALYPDIQRRVDQVMLTNGFTGLNWKTEYFPGEGHTENAWRDRLHIPLAFLLGR